MSINSELIKLRVVLAILLLACLCPLLLLVALLWKIYSISTTFFVKTRKSIKGEVALVTGAGHGLGRAIALELAKLGCHIAVVDINLAGAETTVRQINEISTVRAKAYKVNVTNYNDLIDLRSNVVRDLGTITILVNNAGMLLPSNLQDPDPRDVQRTIDVNLTSHFWTKSIFLPSMKQLRKGHIVSISSLSSIIPLPYATAYTATKFGVNGHMRALRMELAVEEQHNIHVCTVMPWFLKTNNDVSDLVQNIELDRIYPLISGEAAARRIVQGMLCGEREIMIPGIGALLYRIMVLLPVSWPEMLTPMIAGDYFRKLFEYRP